jgi:hypothetical protein
MTAKVKKAFHRCNTEVDYIPGGYTSKLQMLDVGVNKPFKDGIRDELEKWISSYETRKPERSKITEFISTSWANIKTSTIVNSWKHVLGVVTYQELQPDFNIMLDRHDPLSLE